MMTKLAHMRANRKNNKGFSLVELIIVIAIMVALIAVMGPQYVKYIQKSRDSAIASAAEDLQSYVKSAIADPETNLECTAAGTDGTIKIDCFAGTLNVKVAGLSVTKTGAEKAALTAETLGQDAGFTVGKTMGKSTNGYVITVKGNGNVTMAKETLTAAYA